MHPNLITLATFCFVTSFTPGPNNILASYSGFNFGIKKTFPLMLGVALGYTSVVFVLDIGLITVFKKFPIIQEIIKILGSVFLIYLAYKISFSKSSNDNVTKNPVKFINTFFFQFMNPKAVVVAIITVSTFVTMDENYVLYSTWVVGVSFFLRVLALHFGHYLENF